MNGAVVAVVEGGAGTLEQRQGMQTGSPKEIAFVQGWIDCTALAALQIMDDRFKANGDPSSAQVQSKIDARVTAEAAFLASGQNASNHPKLLAARAAHDAWGILPGIAIPTLVFAGRYDQQAPVARAENIANTMPNATLHVVDGGHSPCFATAEPVATIIQDRISPAQGS